MLKKILTFLISIFAFVDVFEATSLCTYTEQNELKEKAANVKASYEIMQETEEELDGVLVNYYINISITNVTDDFYVIVKNASIEEKRYDSQDAKDGIITIRWNDVYEIASFTIEVYSSNNVKCPDERYKTLYLTLPRFNEYSNRAVCNDLDDQDFCKQFVNFKTISEEEFYKKVSNFLKKEEIVENKEENSKEKEDAKNLISIIDDYKWYIIGGLSIILVILVIISVIRRKQNPNDYKKHGDL